MEYKNLYSKVSKPSYYLGKEINAVIKEEQDIKLKFGLAFPDLYEIGSSHFGMQILYDILNRDDETQAERIFVPLPDMAEELRKNKVSIAGLENKTPLRDFNILGFSLLYELNYTGVLEIMDLGNIPFYSKDRDESYPLVIAGGPCMVNPEPIADFFDVILVGDGEEALPEICEVYKKWMDKGGDNKEELLFEMKNIKGVYVPLFFEDKEGKKLYLDNKFDDYEKVEKRLVKDLETALFPTSPVIPFGKPVHDRLRLEISRGCSRGCRFCQAGMIYRPVRERSITRLLDIVEESIYNTGYEDLSLLSLSTGDYTCFPELLSHLMNRYQKESRSVSLPSIRAGRLTSDLMEEIKKVRKTGFTIAPEAGSQRLRNVINKDLSEDQIVDTVKSAFEMGWQLIKLYFMIGLPTETNEDLDGLVELVKKLKFLPEAKKGQINVSLTTFIPKSHTPFQWENQITREESKEKFLYIKDKLKIRNVRLKWQDPEHSRLEGLFARGDRSLSKLIVRAYEEGCHLDGWTEHFNFEKWMEVVEKEGVDIDSYVRKRNPDEELPWDKIDIGIKKSYLKSELEKGLVEKVTRDCRIEKCSGCGICDFKEVYPKMFEESIGKAVEEEVAQTDEKVIKLEINFEKKGDAVFFGHLELLSIFQRCFDRSGIKFDFTKGFHPKPKIKFRDTLPVGVESNCESLVVDCFDFDIVPFLNKVNDSLPKGLFIKTIEKKEKKYSFPANYISEYSIDFEEEVNFKEETDSFFNEDTFEITLVKKGKDRIYDLRKWFKEVSIRDKKSITMKILSENGKKLRPEIFLTNVLNMDKEDIKNILITKIKETEIL